MTNMKRQELVVHDSLPADVALKIASFLEVLLNPWDLSNVVCFRSLIFLALFVCLLKGHFDFVLVNF